MITTQLITDTIRHNGTYTPPADPRPDLFLDAAYWGPLLFCAWLPNDDDLVAVAFWTFKIARELGAALMLEDGKAKIRRGQMKQAEYDQLRDEWLLPVLPFLRPWLEHPEKWLI